MFHNKKALKVTPDGTWMQKDKTYDEYAKKVKSWIKASGFQITKAHWR